MKILLYMSPGAPIKRFLYKFSNEITGPWVSVLHSKIGLEFRFLPAETGTHLHPHQSLSLWTFFFFCFSGIEQYSFWSLISLIQISLSQYNIRQWLLMVYKNLLVLMSSYSSYFILFYFSLVPVQLYKGLYWFLSLPNTLDSQSFCSQPSFCLGKYFPINIIMCFPFSSGHFLKDHCLLRTFFKLIFLPSSQPIILTPLPFPLYFLHSAYNFLTYCVIYLFLSAKR